MFYTLNNNLANSDEAFATYKEGMKFGVIDSIACEFAEMDNLKSYALTKVNTSLPYGVGLHIPWDRNFILQIWTQLNTNVVKYRTFGGGVWSAWKDLSTADELNNRVKIVDNPKGICEIRFPINDQEYYYLNLDGANGITYGYNMVDGPEHSIVYFEGLGASPTRGSLSDGATSNVSWADGGWTRSGNVCMVYGRIQVVGEHKWNSGSAFVTGLPPCVFTTIGDGGYQPFLIAHRVNDGVIGPVTIDSDGSIKVSTLATISEGLYIIHGSYICK